VRWHDKNPFVHAESVVTTLPITTMVTGGCFVGSQHRTPRLLRTPLARASRVYLVRPGDQANQPSLAGLRVRFRCPLPSAFMPWTSRLPSRELTNAIFRASGDQAEPPSYQAGPPSYAGLRVSLRCPLPSAFMT
jgi:hypothetical protein